MHQSTAPTRRKVLWLPAHPTAGAMSMDRHWRELEQVRVSSHQDADAPAWDITCPLGPPLERTRRAGRLRRGWEKYYAYPAFARRAVETSRPDLVHVLDHSFAHVLRGIANSAQGGPFTVITVHDLAPLREDGGAGLNPHQRERFQRTVDHLRLADLVLADSQYSADDAIRLVGVAENRLRVLPQGVNVQRFAEPPPVGATPPVWLGRLPAGRPVVLSVGVTAERKNLGLLPAVFRELGDSACLLRVGELLPDPLRAELRAVLGKDGLTELGMASEEDLVVAYRRADALLFPSRLEGFGFPLLEAMAAGCPVVSSNASSLPEVGGEAALYFSPSDAVIAASHLRRLFKDKDFRCERISLGRIRASAFSWEAHLAALREIYRECLH